MPMQADTDRDLARAGERQRRVGTRFVVPALAAIAIGLLLVVLSDNTFVDAAGIVIAFFGAVAMLPGVGLFLSGLVSRRVSRKKPFA